MILIGPAFRGKKRARVAYPKTSDGVLTHADSDEMDRAVLILVEVMQAFADGDGAQPTFKIGETGNDDAFAVAADFADLAEGDRRAFVGVLTADADVIVTATAATGTGTGAIKVTVVMIPAETDA